MKTWSSEIMAEVDTINSTLEWVCFPNLNMVFFFFYESFLLRLASVISKRIKVDMNTLHEDHGRFGWTCVELNLHI